MGNQVLQCGHCTKEGFNELAPACGKYAQACGVNDIDLSRFMCDPAGVLFAENIQHLGEREQQLFHFAGTGNLAALRWLFVFRANHEICDTNDTTPLHVACRTGSLQVVKDLVRRGCNINAVDVAGWTPLHVASCMGRQDVSLYLLHAGAKANCRNSRGQLPEDLCSHPCTKEVVVGYDTSARARPSPWALPKRSLEAHVDLESHLYSSGGENDWGGSSLHFEPFFVPRDAVLHEPKIREDLQQLGVDVFNRSPGHGIAFLVAAGIVPDYPVNINNFLVKENAEPGPFGDFLGEDCPIAQTLRLEFLNSLQLLGTGIVSALQVACRDICMPADLVKVDRLLRGVAHFWWQQHEEELTEKQDGTPDTSRSADLRSHGAKGELAGLQLQQTLLGTDALHRLLFSTLMLYKWLQAGNEMTLNDWLELNTGIEAGGNDVPMQAQKSIYCALTEHSAGLQDRLVPQKPPPKPVMVGWAHLRYSGRAQVSHDGDPAAWTAATPRTLAVQGGVTSAGRASPLPGGAGEEEHVEAVKAISSLVHSLRRDELPQQQTAGDEERAWLCLHGTILFLYLSQAEDAPPYAFASLRKAELSHADPVSRRLVLRGRPEVAKPTPTVNDDEWLELCLLLSDGRFQQLEAPRLELRMEQQSEYEVWATHLRRACRDNSSLPAQNIIEALEQNLPQLLSSKWADEPVAPAPPFVEEERYLLQRMVAV